jgi:hypothetical protein
MVLHLFRNQFHVDVWVVVLLGLAAFPWYAPSIESVAFPGGSVKFRELKERVDRQGEDIKALTFLMANFLTEEQHHQLRRFAEVGPIEVHNANSPGQFMLMDELQRFDFVRRLVGHDELYQIRGNDHWRGDLKALYAITNRGREYLRLRDAV